MMFFKRFVVIFLLLLATGMLVTGAVEAHAGGRMQVASVDGGDFKFTVWTSPDPAVPGEVHVTTSVASIEDALPVLDAEVFIEMVPQDGQGETLSGQATTEASVNQFLYETIFDVPDEGIYEVTVTALGSGVEWGAVTFDLEVESAPPLWLGIVGIVVLGVVTGGAVWFYLRSSSQSSVASSQ